MKLTRNKENKPTYSLRDTSIKGIHADYPENFLSTQKVYFEWLTNKKDEDGGTKSFDFKKDEEVQHRDLEGNFIVDGYVENSLPHEYGRYYWVKKQRKAEEVLWESQRMLADGDKLYRANPSSKISQEAVQEREAYWKRGGQDNVLFCSQVPTTPTEDKFVLYQANFEGWMKKGKVTERLGVVEEKVNYQNVYAQRLIKEKTDSQSKRLRPGKKERQETKQRTHEGVNKEFGRPKEKEEGRKEFEDKNDKRQHVKLKPAELPENFEQYQMDENESYDENLNYGEEEELRHEEIDASEYEEPAALVVTEETDRSVLN